MAILKHVTSKNSNYRQAVNYLIFKYDEHLNKPILDENGNRQMRDCFIMDGINCTPLMFRTECNEVNQKYGKNFNRNEVKSHHYIISFDPDDVTDCGLTPEKAQELGMEYARENFPGFQCLVATHGDGNNKSGNIHVHIVFNSVRKYDVPEQQWAERPSDRKAGQKHRCSHEELRYYKQNLMSLCEREHLNQVDLLNEPEVRVSDREYRAKQRGQEELDQKNARLIAAGETPKQTVFQTQKDELRTAIEDSLMYATSMEDFQKTLKDTYGIELFNKKNRLSYLHPDRNKNISERALGTNYGLEYINSVLEANAQRAEQTAQKQVSEQIASVTAETQKNLADEYDIFKTEPESVPDQHYNFHKFDPNYDYKSNPTAAAWVQSELKPVVDIENGPIAQKCRAYKGKVAASNLQKLVDTVVVCEKNQLTYEDIDNRLTAVNDQIHYLGQYLNNRDTYKEFRESKDKVSFRKEHPKEISDYEEARKWLNERFPRDENGKTTWPIMKNLNTQKKTMKTLKKNLEFLKTWEYPEWAPEPEPVQGSKDEKQPEKTTKTTELKKSSVWEEVSKNQEKIAKQPKDPFHTPQEKSL